MVLKHTHAPGCPCVRCVRWVALARREEIHLRKLRPARTHLNELVRILCNRSEHEFYERGITTPLH